ncbi:DNA adenine methylase [[Mycoplasma] collis]|uniref:DNA adenine methylase n=1 Tax=[Mycoplasma] collis TaxID=2127 RepID=UPI00051C30F0|nr:Dam family site-specific DNA-(adenine-N6)-methyltransferase [[Mycoplasma] collis]
MKTKNTKNDLIVKPFLKWVGGKGQLLKEISQFYPFENKNIYKYCEPFVGGGAVLFDILTKYKLKEIYISDLNKNLINSYLIIKNHVHKLINILKKMESDFLNLNNLERKEFYLNKRKEFNSLIKLNTINKKIFKAALLIFLNKTCFNGLYRVNKNNEFNVPMGTYNNPLICDEENLLNISKKLKNIKIIFADYKKTINFIDENTFVYLDPPYRPITKSSSFVEYTIDKFDDENQKELADFINEINKKNCLFLMSNSDPKNYNSNDNFFDDLYKEFHIKRINAKRSISSNPETRKEIKELLIFNFKNEVKF